MCWAAAELQNMKTTAHLMVAIGLAWLMTIAFSSGPVARGVAVTRMSALPDKPCFQKHEVQDEIRATAMNIHERAPRMWIPASIMVWGYVMLSLARRDVSAQQPAPLVPGSRVTPPADAGAAPRDPAGEP